MRTEWSHELARADPGPNMRLEDYMGKPPSTALVQEKSTSRNAIWAALCEARD